MDEILQLKKLMEEKRPVEWEQLPDIALYMDQLISYMPRQLIHFEEDDALTSSMVNNYSKSNLLPRSAGKRYLRDHLSGLTMISAMKKVLSMKDMEILLKDLTEQAGGYEKAYGSFCAKLDVALKDADSRIDEDVEESELAEKALELALNSYAQQLACERMIELIRAKRETADDGKKSKK